MWVQLDNVIVGWVIGAGAAMTWLFMIVRVTGESTLAGVIFVCGSGLPIALVAGTIIARIMGNRLRLIPAIIGWILASWFTQVHPSATNPAVDHTMAVTAVALPLRAGFLLIGIVTILWHYRRSTRLNANSDV